MLVQRSNLLWECVKRKICLTETEVNAVFKKLHELLSGYETYGELVIEKDRELKVY